MPLFMSPSSIEATELPPTLPLKVWRVQPSLNVKFPAGELGRKLETLFKRYVPPSLIVWPPISFVASPIHVCVSNLFPMIQAGSSPRSISPAGETRGKIANWAADLKDAGRPSEPRSKPSNLLSRGLAL